MNEALFERLMALQVEKTKREVYDEATLLPESSYGATQSRVLLLEFTSFLELRKCIKACRWRNHGDNPGAIYMGSCEVLHIHHGDYSKCAVLKVSTHRDI